MDTWASPWAFISTGWAFGFFAGVLIHYFVISLGIGFVEWVGEA